jgi:hypothetical protein
MQEGEGAIMLPDDIREVALDNGEYRVASDEMLTLCETPVKQRTCRGKSRKSKGSLEKGAERGVLNRQWAMHSRAEKGVEGLGDMDTVE